MTGRFPVQGLPCPVNGQVFGVFHDSKSRLLVCSCKTPPASWSRSLQWIRPRYPLARTSAADSETKGKRFAAGRIKVDKLSCIDAVSGETIVVLHATVCPFVALKLAIGIRELRQIGVGKITLRCGRHTSANIKRRDGTPEPSVWRCSPSVASHRGRVSQDRAEK